MSSARSRIRVVLVGPREPGNVGATARAIANTGLGELVVVASDRTRLDDPRASRMAAGGADVLERARVAATLDEALADTVLAAGFTARARVRIEPAPGTLREVAPRILREAERGMVALVFGPEDHGLTNVDLDRCTVLVTIPADERYPVLNLAASVLVAGYELVGAERSTGAPAGTPEATPGALTPASLSELERLYERFDQVLVKARFLKMRRRQGLVTLRGIVARTALQRREYRFLMGALERIESTMDRHVRSDLVRGGP